MATKKTSAEKSAEQKAYEIAQQEIYSKKVEEVKRLILLSYERLDAEKRLKALSEERMRIIKMDIEDLRRGNFDKIDERRRLSRVAQEVSSVPDLETLFPTSDIFPMLTAGSEYWMTLTAGTYIVNGRPFYLQSF